MNNPASASLPAFGVGIVFSFFKHFDSVTEKNTFWLYVGTVSLDLLFVAVVVIIRHNSLPQRTLSLCLMVRLKCLCSAHREIICNPPPPPPHTLTFECARKKRLIYPFPDAGHSWDILQGWWPLFASSLPLPLYSAFWLVPCHLSLVL